MDKRVVIFLVLSLAIILGFDFLIKQMGWLPEPPPAQDVAVPGPSSTEREPAPAPVTGKDSGSTGLSLPAKSGQKSSPPSSDISPATSEQTVTVETDLVRAELSNRGGEAIWGSRQPKSGEAAVPGANAATARSIAPWTRPCGLPQTGFDCATLCRLERGVVVGAPASTAASYP